MMNEFRKFLEKEKENILFMEKRMHMFESLTEKRVQIIRTIMQRHPNSIRELAEFLHRDIKNVFDDLKILDNLGVIRFVRAGRKKQPIVRRKFIIISFE